MHTVVEISWILLLQCSNYYAIPTLFGNMEKYWLMVIFRTYGMGKSFLVVRKKNRVAGNILHICDILSIDPGREV